MARTIPTRQRLLDAGMELFSRRGFDATSVGDIEAAAGLQPRRGALYKHFASKQDLLEQALRSHLDTAAALASDVRAVAVGHSGQADKDGLRPLVQSLGRWFLKEMDKMEDLTRILEHDGRRLPTLVDEVKTEIVDLSYRSATESISIIAGDLLDPEAFAVVLLGALVALRRTTWTFGSPPLHIDEERVLGAWTELALANLESRAHGSRA